MADKKIDTYIKLQVPAGAASPSPPVGPALGQHGVNLMDFCNAFNSKTNDLEKNVPCLLYTSPSPRDRISSRMPASA